MLKKTHIKQLIKPDIVKAIENIRITIRDLDGNIIEQTILKNTITNLLFNLYRDALAGDLGNILDFEIRYLAYGTDDGTILALDITNWKLGAETDRIAVTSFSKPAVGRYRTVFYLAPADGVGWIRELGVFAGIGANPAADSGTLIARVFWERNKTALESIQFERLDGITEA